MSIFVVIGMGVLLYVTVGFWGLLFTVFGACILSWLFID